MESLTCPPRIILSGCSGGGKSTLLEELARRGYAVYPEPGRLVVQEQLAIDGDGLPWKDGIRFTELCAQKSIEFYDAATRVEGPVFFDRSPLDHVIGLKRLGIPVPPLVEAAAVHCRYHFTVFLVPPWQEIYVTDAERRHSFEAAVEEYQGLVQGYQSLQFRVVILPHTTVAERADIVEREL